MPPDFPSRLRSERSRLGLTQVEAAERASMSRDSYHQLEQRIDNDPRLSTLARLVRAGFKLRAIAPQLLNTKENLR